jgi:hypothetical protein
MSELTIDYEMTQEHRENPIIFAARCSRHPLGQAALG